MKLRPIILMITLFLIPLSMAEWLEYQNSSLNLGFQTGSSNFTSSDRTNYSVSTGQNFQPLVANFTGDAKLETIIHNGTDLIMYNDRLIEIARTGVTYTLLAEPAIFDNGSTRYIAAVANNNLYLYKYNGSGFDQTVYATQCLSQAQTRHSGVRCSGGECVYFCNQDGATGLTINVLNSSGFTSQTTSAGAGLTFSNTYEPYIFAIDDLDLDSDDDIIFGRTSFANDDDYGITVLDSGTGHQRATFFVGNIGTEAGSGYQDELGYPRMSNAVLYDLDTSTSNKEVIVSHQDSAGNLSISVFNSTGKLVWEYDSGQAVTSVGPVVMTDLGGALRYPCTIGQASDNISYAICTDEDGNSVLSESFGPIASPSSTSPNFMLVAADTDNDGTDELVTGAGIVDGSSFTNLTGEFGYHGVVQDINNDGELDIVYTREYETKFYFADFINTPVVDNITLWGFPDYPGDEVFYDDMNIDAEYFFTEQQANDLSTFRWFVNDTLTLQGSTNNGQVDYLPKENTTAGDIIILEIDPVVGASVPFNSTPINITARASEISIYGAQWEEYQNRIDDVGFQHRGLANYNSTLGTILTQTVGDVGTDGYQVIVSNLNGQNDGNNFVVHQGNFLQVYDEDYIIWDELELKNPSAPISVYNVTGTKMILTGNRTHAMAFTFNGTRLFLNTTATMPGGRNLTGSGIKCRADVTNECYFLDSHDDVCEWGVGSGITCFLAGNSSSEISAPRYGALEDIDNDNNPEFVALYGENRRDVLVWDTQSETLDTGFSSDGKQAITQCGGSNYFGGRLLLWDFDGGGERDEIGNKEIMISSVGGPSSSTSASICVEVLKNDGTAYDNFPASISYNTNGTAIPITHWKSDSIAMCDLGNFYYDVCTYGRFTATNVASYRTKRIVCFNENGSTAVNVGDNDVDWSTWVTFPPNWNGGLSCADVDSDNIDEIIIPTEIYDTTSQSIITDFTSSPLSTTSQYELSVADINGDDELDMFLTQEGTLKILMSQVVELSLRSVTPENTTPNDWPQYQNGPQRKAYNNNDAAHFNSSIGQITTVSDGRTRFQPLVAKLSGTQNNIIIVDNPNVVKIYNENLTSELDSYTVPSSLNAHPYIQTFEENKFILTGNKTHTIRLSFNGTNISVNNTAALPSTNLSGSSFACSDQNTEMCYFTNTQDNVCAWNTSTTSITCYPIYNYSGEWTYDRHPAIADIDRDGNEEFVSTVAGNTILVFDTGTNTLDTGFSDDGLLGFGTVGGRVLLWNFDDAGDMEIMAVSTVTQSVRIDVFKSNGDSFDNFPKDVAYTGGAPFPDTFPYEMPESLAMCDFGARYRSVCGLGRIATNNLVVRRQKILGCYDPNGTQMLVYRSNSDVGFGTDYGWAGDTGIACADMDNDGNDEVVSHWGIIEHETSNLINNFYSTVPGVNSYHQSLVSDVDQNGELDVILSTTGTTKLVRSNYTNLPPTPATNILPNGGETFLTGANISINWTAGTDPDGDSLTYFVAFSSNNGSTYTELGSTNLTVFYWDSTGQPTASTYKVRAITSDGFENVTTESADVFSIIDQSNNTAPNVSNVNITPDPAVTTDTLTCQWTYSDAEGNPDNSITTWYVNSVQVKNETSSGSDSTLTSGFFSKSDVVNCTVRGSDGVNSSNTTETDSITISNSAPTFSSLTFLDNPSQKEDTLTCNVVGRSDADGDNMTNYYKFLDTNNITVLQDWSTTNTLDCSLTSGCGAGDTITCVALVGDGEDNSTENNNSLSISGTAPESRNVFINPTFPNVTTDLNCTYDYFDQDGDSEIAQYFRWFKNDTLQLETDQILGGGNLTNGDRWKCEVIVSDGTNSTPVNSSSVAVGEQIPAIIIFNNTGEVNEGESITFSWTWDSPKLPSGTPFNHYVCNTSNANSAGCIDGELCSVQDDSSPSSCSFSPGSDNSRNNTAYLIIVDGDNLTSDVSLNSWLFNHKPTAGSVSLNISKTNEYNIYTCVLSGVSDSDGDSTSNFYQFSNGASIIQSFSGTNTLIVNSGQGTHGEIITCTGKSYDSKVFSDTVTNSSHPKISSISFSSNPTIDQTMTISVFISNTTTISNTPSINFESPAPFRRLFSNETLTFNPSTGAWEFSFAPDTVGTWTVTESSFSQDDSQGYLFIGSGDSFLVSEQAATEDGGGGTVEIKEIQKLVNLTNFCGDNICQEGENPANCFDDCRVNFDTLVTCLFEEDIPCNWQQDWFPTFLILLLIITASVSIYITEVKKRKKRRR